MIITYDMSFFQNLPVSADNTIFKTNVEKAIKIAI
jgi:leishmanolysin